MEAWYWGWLSCDSEQCWVELVDIWEHVEFKGWLQSSIGSGVSSQEEEVGRPRMVGSGSWLGWEGGDQVSSWAEYVPGASLSREG